ncbi:DUF2142 domain-containing protein [Nocardioides sp. KIGAM211]|uniref:DUF2142 domain-containing protein n=1 Tax=Nocardioides luti TaxID=2761101 RepID=A0A7X0V9M4_9ACTN|nr:DUF2142 domain-containing protein [Nocardioides luti]MBB6626430.1 DUF2142 domain-containing protein [Nocardioides luti]
MSGAARRTWALFALTFVGISLVQLAWALVVPPFRGSDEHDHVFRAAAVARGEWRPDFQRVEDGRGDLVTVPGDLVTAAHPVCAALPYTGPDDCSASRTLADGQVQVGSAAARYHPAFYWVVGTAARPWHGAEAVYAMRAATAALCAALVALTLVTLRRSATTVWPGAALLVVLTPVTTYSMSIVAANGVEMAAGALLWAALLGVSRRRGAQDVRWFGPALLGACLLVTLRSLGPLWFVLILLAAALAVGRSAWWSALVDLGRTRLLAGGLLLGACLAGGVAWTMTSGTNQPAATDSFTGSPWPGIVEQPVVWVLQTVAAFPARDDSASPIVYALGLILFWALLAAGWRTSDGRGRLAAGLVVLASVLLPLAITVLTFASVGFAWQGRYGWPLALGVLLLAGRALDGAATQPSRRVGLVLVAAVAAVLATATAVGQLGVLHGELVTSPLATDPAWLRPSGALVVLLTALGCGLVALAAVNRRDEPAEAATTMPTRRTSASSLSR